MANTNKYQVSYNGYVTMFQYGQYIPMSNRSLEGVTDLVEIVEDVTGLSVQAAVGLQDPESHEVILTVRGADGRLWVYRFVFRETL